MSRKDSSEDTSGRKKIIQKMVLALWREVCHEHEIKAKEKRIRLVIAALPSSFFFTTSLFSWVLSQWCWLWHCHPSVCPIASQRLLHQNMDYFNPSVQIFLLFTVQSCYQNSCKMQNPYHKAHAQLRDRITHKLTSLLLCSVSQWQRESRIEGHCLPASSLLLASFYLLAKLFQLS